MIKGIGIDTIEINRFSDWHHKSNASLLRIFSSKEITYCKSQPTLSAERFAARFAAREAFFKAYCATGAPYIPFLSMCRALSIINGTYNEPKIEYTQTPEAIHISHHLSGLTPHITITHTKTNATALVIISQ